MISIEKVTKLRERLSHLVTYLERCHELTLHQQIDQSFYMERIEELKILSDRRHEAAESLAILDEAIAIKYKFCFRHWRKDVRYLNSFLLNSARRNTIL